MGSLIQGEEAVKNGASFITHLFNAMLPVRFNAKKQIFVSRFIRFMFIRKIVSSPRSRFNWTASLFQNSLQ